MGMPVDLSRMCDSGVRFRSGGSKSSTALPYDPLCVSHCVSSRKMPANVITIYMIINNILFSNDMLCNQQVRGSNPLNGTNNIKYLLLFLRRRSR
jgi:hypothetical protein